MHPAALMKVTRGNKVTPAQVMCMTRVVPLPFHVTPRRPDIWAVRLGWMCTGECANTR